MCAPLAIPGFGRTLRRVLGVGLLLVTGIVLGLYNL